MRLLVIILLLLLSSVSGKAQQVQFKTSKQYCVLNFLETATQQPRTLPSLYEFIQAQTANDAKFKALCQEYSTLQLHPSYRFDGYPTNRLQDYNIYNLLVAAAIGSNTQQEFKEKILGYLPNAELIKLLSVMQRAESYYDRLIWNTNEKKLAAQVKALKQYDKVVASTMQAAQVFYNTSWPVNTPFNVSLFPVPGKNEGMIATPHVNNLCVGVLIDTTDYTLKVSIILHEMCHIFYKEQAKELQRKLEAFFLKNPSRYSPYAYNYLDEALATTLGNGWGLKQITGSLKEGRWYGDEYIDGFAKVLYPLVEDYLTRRKAIDSSFVSQSISLFEKRFPRATTDYKALLFPRVTVYTESEEGSMQLYLAIAKKFNLQDVSVNALSDKENLEKLKAAKGTQLIILAGENNKYINDLNKLFPQLKEGALKPNSLLSFFDAKQRPVIILLPEKLEQVDGLLKRMRENQYFDSENIVQR